MSILGAPQDESSRERAEAAGMYLDTEQEALERRVVLLERKVALQTEALKLLVETLNEVALWMRENERG